MAYSSLSAFRRASPRLKTQLTKISRNISKGSPRIVLLDGDLPRNAKERGSLRGTHTSSNQQFFEDRTRFKYGVAAVVVGVIGYGVFKRRRTTECQEGSGRLAIRGRPNIHDDHLKLDIGPQIISKAQPKDEKSSKIALSPGDFRSDLPIFSKAEITSHKSKETGMWVTYKNGVYDITEFIEQHPGGAKILLAAGGSLEPFWGLYAVHKTQEVFEILEGLRIGNTDPKDQDASQKDLSDPYRNDPDRHPAMKINSLKPFNAESPPELLVDGLVTPNEIFFVRNHLPVPKIDINEYSLEINGAGLKASLNVSLDELKKRYKSHTFMATLQCAGNRRADMNDAKKVIGLSWTGTAISNAEWTGVLLRDVLLDAGIKEDDPEAVHVHFVGYDKDPTGERYGASIPIEIAMDPKREVLLAYEMNGEELPSDHGYPVRVVVPGVVGARNVKWLKSIRVSQNESPSHWQQNDYKGFGPSEDWDTIDFKKATAIQDYPIQSAIMEPAEGATLPDNEEVTMRGYAWSGGGRGIIRVDVSIDGGQTWQKATLTQTKQKAYRQWAWTLWEASIPIPKDHNGTLKLCCKSVDTSYNVQPEHAEGIWNVRGLLHNAWHRVKVIVPDEADE